MTPEAISTLRKDLGLSQMDFARLFDCHFMTISKWERGVAAPTPYQRALMTEFRKAANLKRAEVQGETQRLLVGAGVIAALFWLLNEAKN